VSRFGVVDGLETLSGGFWSSAYGFVSGGRPLVARFGESREWYEADRAAMAFGCADLSVPDVLEVGAALGGAYAISERRYGTYLESVDVEKAANSGPMLTKLLLALYNVPKTPTTDVAWHGNPPAPGATTWKKWLQETLLAETGPQAEALKDVLSTDARLRSVYRAGQQKAEQLIQACPERRDLVHRDLLHGNVLINDDATKVNAVFSWKCSVRGDFLYDTSWCTFWGESFFPGIAAADAWGGVTASLRGADEAALMDAELRHHCYELHIGLTHMRWHAWTGEREFLEKDASHLAKLVERGPLKRVRSPS
jgi:aminoglycoside phosphotransferase (APT) family kinase protein